MLGGLLLACAAGGALWLARPSKERAAVAPPPTAVEHERAEPVVELAPPAKLTEVVELAGEGPSKTRTEAAPLLAAEAAPPEPKRAWAEADEAQVWLHVRDRDSGRELAPVFVVALDGLAASWKDDPGRASESAEDLGASPVSIAAPVEGAIRTLFARSPGYAWGRIELRDAQEERFLDLVPAGDLRIFVAAGPRDPSTQVRVLGAERRLLFEEELGAREELVVPGLPAGPVEVVARIASLLDAREVGRASAEIVPGTTASAKLLLEPVEPARWVPLAGSIVVPPEWGLEDFELGFELQGVALQGWSGEARVRREAMTLANRAAGLHRWSAGDVQPGRYEADLIELGYSAVIEVGPEGARDVHIAIPPPCTVHLRCVDAVTGDATRPEQIYWGSTTDGGPNSLLAVSGWNGQLERFELRVPCGAIRITSVGSRHESRTMDFQVGPGLAELELVLRAPTALRPILMDGTREVPWEVRRMPALVPLDEQESAGSWTLRERRLTMKVDEPGRYALRVPVLDGYEPVPEQVVELERGVLTEHLIELVRRP